MDLIDREKLLIELKISADHHEENSRDYVLMLRDRNIVREQPTVDAQPVIHGEWLDIPKYTDIAWQCSECKHFTTMKHNYCPNCGAEMDKEIKDVRKSN